MHNQEPQILSPRSIEAGKVSHSPPFTKQFSNHTQVFYCKFVWNAKHLPPVSLYVFFRWDLCAKTLEMEVVCAANTKMFGCWRHFLKMFVLMKQIDFLQQTKGRWWVPYSVLKPTCRCCIRSSSHLHIMCNLIGKPPEFQTNTSYDYEFTWYSTVKPFGGFSWIANKNSFAAINQQSYPSYPASLPHKHEPASTKSEVPFYNENLSRWWFQILFLFIPTWGRFPFWLIFFKWIETTN